MARILLIDDDNTVRTMVSKVLDGLGHTVIEARDGEEGLDLLPHINADLLITDLVMPRKDGLAVLAAVRDSYPPLKVIAMSGDGQRGPISDLERTRSLGAARVLRKPFTLGVLRAAVTELLAPGASGIPVSSCSIPGNTAHAR